MSSESAGTILIVDDTPANLKLLAGMLTDRGYRVLPAKSGRIALQACARTLPDLVLLDINMPEMDGYEVCAELKADERTADVPVIFISALSDTRDKVRAFEAGGVDYVPKPFQFEEILARVEAHLTISRLRAELAETNASLERRVELRTEQLASLNDAYARFVPREFLAVLGRESIADIELGDQSAEEMTVLFSDIRGFMTLSESMTPQETFDFLNEYLGRVGPIIASHGGFIDKFVGDSIMALFPGPTSDAVDAAIEMAREVRRLSAEREARGERPIEVGYGLHRGPLMLGVIGAENHFEATVIADAVNLASRLESLTRRYDVTILASESTIEGLGDEAPGSTRFLAHVQVKGKREAVRVFEIFESDPEEVRARKLATLSDLEEGIGLYLDRRFAEASVPLSRARETDQNDRVISLYLERVAACLVSGVDDEWTGVERLNEK